MTAIAPHITMFLRERLPVQRGASVHTCDSYAYAFQLLFEFASQQYRVAPSGLQLEQIDAPLVLAFLDHLETKRGNSPNTRNVRLAGADKLDLSVRRPLPADWGGTTRAWNRSG